MPWHASAKKRLRRDTKKRLSNKSAVSTLRTIVKKASHDLTNKDLVEKAQKTLAMAASKGIIHPNAAARKTGRLMKKAFMAAHPSVSS
jgi:small subunit ribosomal protein S20